MVVMVVSPPVMTTTSWGGTLSDGKNSREKNIKIAAHSIVYLLELAASTKIM
jgi:hypothetical protein